MTDFGLTIVYLLTDDNLTIKKSRRIMNRDAFELGFTLDEFTTEVNRGSKVQFINHQTEPLWRKGHTPDQARTELLKTSEDDRAAPPALEPDPVFLRL